MLREGWWEEPNQEGAEERLWADSMKWKGHRQRREGLEWLNHAFSSQVSGPLGFLASILRRAGFGRQELLVKRPVIFSLLQKDHAKTPEEADCSCWPR